jgi:hypothetical protein
MLLYRDAIKMRKDSIFLGYAIFLSAFQLKISQLFKNALLNFHFL